MPKDSNRTLLEKKKWRNVPDMLISKSLVRAYSAVIDEHVSREIVLKFWMEFFSHWMVSQTLSVFGQQDDGLTDRPPDLCVGHWTDYQNSNRWGWPTEVRILLAVGCCRDNETIECVEESLYDWAKKYMAEIYALRQQPYADEDGQLTHAYEYYDSVWVAFAGEGSITFYKCEWTLVQQGDAIDSSFSRTPICGQHPTGRVQSWLNPLKDGGILHPMLCELIKEH